MALAARESAASVRERQDGRTCDTQSDDGVTAGGGGVACGIPGDG